MRLLWQPRTFQLFILRVANFPQAPQTHLGFIRQQDGPGTQWGTNILQQIREIHRMLTRVTCHKHGLKEHELQKVVERPRHVFVPVYIQFPKKQDRGIETALRKCTELGLTNCVPIFSLADTAPRNILVEKTSVHHEAQHDRLTTSPQGLEGLGYPT